MHGNEVPLYNGPLEGKHARNNSSVPFCQVVIRVVPLRPPPSVYPSFPHLVRGCVWGRQGSFEGISSTKFYL